MADMTPRERLHAVLDRQPTDRVPFWLLFPYHPTGYYVDVRHHPAYRPVHEASAGKAIILNRRNPNVPLFTDAVKTRHETVHENGVEIRRTVIEHNGASLRRETRSGPDGTTVKRFLESEEDLAVYASFPILDDEAEIARRMEAQLADYCRERDEFPPEWGEMMLDLGEPVNPVYHSADLAEYPVWSLTCPEVVEGFLERNMRRVRAVYKWCLERELAATYFLVGSELASPPLLSRSTFQRWIVPYARELVDLIHAHGAKAIQHYHGQIKSILPDFLDMGADALHTIEAPPTGDCTFTDAYAVTGDRIALIGNVQYDRFRAATPEEIAAETRAVIDECRGRPFILSPSAGPYEAEPSERVIRNYLSFIDAAWTAPWP